VSQPDGILGTHTLRAGPDLPPAVRGIELLSLRHEVVP